MKTVLIIWWNSLLWKSFIKKLLEKWFLIISTYNRDKIGFKDKNLKQYKLNLLDTSSIDLCLDKIFSLYDIDIFIFNSSVRKFWLLIDLWMDEFDEIYRVNVYSLLYIYKKYLFSYFKNKKNSLLLNIWTILCLLLFPFSQTCWATRSFQRSIVYWFDLELSKYCLWFKNVILWAIKYEKWVLVNRNTPKSNTISNSCFDCELRSFKKNMQDISNLSDNIDEVVEELSDFLLNIDKNKLKKDIIIWKNTKKLLKENNILYPKTFLEKI